MNRIIVLCALPEETQGLIEEYVPTYYTGVGKVNAAMTAMKSIIDYNPDLIINFGTAGSSKVPKDTLIDCTNFIQRDMHVKELGFDLGVTPFEDKDTSLLSFETENPINKRLTCGTGDTFVNDMSNTPYDVVDMEAYAIAKCCYECDVDFVSFKYITDGANDDAASDWNENCKKGAVAFVEILKKNMENKNE